MPSTAATHPNALNARRSVGSRDNNDQITPVEMVLADWWKVMQTVYGEESTTADSRFTAWKHVSQWCHGAYRYAGQVGNGDAAVEFYFAAGLAIERAKMEIR